MTYGWSREQEVHWRRIAKEMPRLRATIRVEDRYPKECFDALFRVVLPGEMEDKWIVFPGTEETVVDFHRSWTGFHLYRVYLFEDDDGSWYIDRVDVNRDPDEYSETDDAYDGQLVRWLIRTLLLNEQREFPADSSLAGDAALFAKWSFGGSAAIPNPRPNDDAGPASPDADPDVPPRSS
jgi:hypothetical protein